MTGALRRLDGAFRNPDRDAATIKAMAAVMTGCAADNGACLESDLLAAGFSRAEINRLGDAARAVAAQFAPKERSQH